jgi:phosphatidylinositol-3-phosphatase
MLDPSGPVRRRVPASIRGVAAVLALWALAGCGTNGAAAHPDGTLAAGRINHVVVIDLENEGFDATFGAGSPMQYLNSVLRPQGELLENYYAIGHVSLDNYIAQVSGQSPTKQTQLDCLANGATFADLAPGTPAPDGQVTGAGCVYPAAVETIASQLDARYPPNPATGVASWRAYEEDMGIDLSRDGGVPDPTGGGDCGHPAIGGKTAVVATAADQYVTRHNPFVWFHSVIDQPALCRANDVPLGTLDANGQPNPGGHLAGDFSNVSSTPRFAFITPNLCNDGHDDTCTGVNSDGTHQGGLTGADSFLRHWMPVILDSPAYREGDTLVVITFDESDTGDTSACCNEQSGPNTTAPGAVGGTSTSAAPGGGRVGALLLNTRYIKAGSTNSVGYYNHYSALRTYEDLLGLDAGGADGKGHLGFAAASGLKPFGPDVFNK